MLQILLIRSGNTEYDEQGRIQGTLDIPLSEDGRREADAVIDQLRSELLVAVYSTPCQSAKHIAEALAEAADLNPKTLPNLRNLDHGLWQGLLVDDVKVKQPKVYRQWQEQPETVCPPEGESVTAAKARVAEVVMKLMKKHKEGQVAVVVPEPLASVIRHVLRHDELGNFWPPSNGRRPPAWERIDVHPQLNAAT